MGFPGGSDSKESVCNVGDLGSVPGLERYSGGGHGNPLQYSCLENPHGQRSLAGYSPWGHEELDMTEGLSTAQQQWTGQKKSLLSRGLHSNDKVGIPQIQKEINTSNYFRQT